MMLIQAHPIVATDATTYSRQRGVADYVQQFASGVAHLWGHRGRVLVPGRALPPGAVLGETVTASYTRIAQVYGERTAAGSSGRRITVDVLAWCQASLLATLRVVEDDLAGGASTTQTLDSVSPEMIDGTELGLTAGAVSLLERVALVREGWLRESVGLDGHGLGLLTWTYLPTAGLGVEYQARIELREQSTERYLHRVAAVTVREAVVTAT